MFGVVQINGEWIRPGNMFRVVASTVGSVVIRKGHSTGHSCFSALSFNHSVTRYFLVLGYLDAARLTWDPVTDTTVGSDPVNCLFSPELSTFPASVGVTELLFPLLPRQLVTTLPAVQWPAFDALVFGLNWSGTEKFDSSVGAEKALLEVVWDWFFCSNISCLGRPPGVHSNTLWVACDGNI